MARKTPKQKAKLIEPKSVEPELTDSERYFVADEFAAGLGARPISLTLTAAELFQLVAQLKPCDVLWEQPNDDQVDKLIAKLEEAAGDAIQARLLAEKCWSHGRGVWRSRQARQ